MGRPWLSTPCAASAQRTALLPILPPASAPAPWQPPRRGGPDSGVGWDSEELHLSVHVRTVLPADWLLEKNGSGGGPKPPQRDALSHEGYGVCGVVWWSGRG